MWLGSKRGYLSDWITQRWVKITGQQVDLFAHPWLAGPIAPTTGISSDFFASLARSEGLRLEPPEKGTGVIPEFSSLSGISFDSTRVAPSVARFYEQTSSYELDAWAEWAGLFRPFGWLLAVIFSRRLQQLNVPLSGLDTSEGLTSDVLRLVDPGTELPKYIAWFRRLRGSGNVLYAGFYSVCSVPGSANPCVKVVFPLPNGNAIVIMRTESRADGSFVVTSAGKHFGEPGFYFTVHGDSNKAWARYVKSLRESIHVYSADDGQLRADHVLTYFGMTFLRLHYRMRLRLKEANQSPHPTLAKGQR